VLLTPVAMTFTPGPQSQPIRFHSQISSCNSPSPRPTYCSLILCFLFLPVDTLFIPSCRPRPLLSPAQDRASIFLSIPPCLSALQCSINDASHAFAFRTGILSLVNSYKIEGEVQSSKLYKRATTVGWHIYENPSAHLLPSSHLYSTSAARRLQHCLFILLPIAFLACVLDNVQSYFPSCRPPAVSLVLGTLSLMTNSSLSIYIPHPKLFLSPLFSTSAGEFSIYYTCPGFYFFSSVYQPNIDISFHSWTDAYPQSSSYHQHSYPFHPSYFLVSCVY